MRALIGALQRLCGTRWLDPDLEQRSLLLDADRPGSAAHSLERLRDALEGVRDQLSVRHLARVRQHRPGDEGPARSSRRPQIAESASRMLGGILSLQGVTANMIRDDGWHAIEAGRYLERSLQVCTLLAATTTASLGLGVDRAVLGGVLMAAESSVTHRRRFRGSVRAADVLELLLHRPRQPPVDRVLARARSASTCRSSPAPPAPPGPSACSSTSRTALEDVDIAALTAPVDGRRPRLEEFLADDARPAAPPRRRDRAPALRGRTAAPADLVADADRGHGGALVKYRVSHRTTYSYDDDVSSSFGIAHCRPRELPWQQVPSRSVVDRSRCRATSPTTSTATATWCRTSTSPSRTSRLTIDALSEVDGRADRVRRRRAAGAVGAGAADPQPRHLARSLGGDRVRASSRPRRGTWTRRGRTPRHPSLPVVRSARR